MGGGCARGLLACSGHCCCNARAKPESWTVCNKPCGTVPLRPAVSSLSLRVAASTAQAGGIQCRQPRSQPPPSQMRLACPQPSFPCCPTPTATCACPPPAHAAPTALACTSSWWTRGWRAGATLCWATGGCRAGAGTVLGGRWV